MQHHHHHQGPLQDEVFVFFTAFVTAFAHFDGALIARRYATPYAAVDAAGTWRRLATGPEVAGYFQDIVSQYHQQGCRACRFHGLEVLPLPGHGALASVTWELLDGAGQVLGAWRESYTLVRSAAGGGGGLHIAASIDHGPGAAG